MAAILGDITGGTIAVVLLSLLWEWALLRWMVDDPLKSKLGAVAAAFLTCCILAGFGSATGGAWRPDASLKYVPGAILMGIFAYRRGLKLRAAREEEPDDYSSE
jgi:hypothetical protein